MKLLASDNLTLISQESILDADYADYTEINSIKNQHQIKKADGRGLKNLSLAYFLLRKSAFLAVKRRLSGILNFFEKKRFFPCIGGSVLIYYV